MEGGKESRLGKFISRFPISVRRIKDVRVRRLRIIRMRVRRVYTNRMGPADANTFENRVYESRGAQFVEENHSRITTCEILDSIHQYQSLFNHLRWQPIADRNEWPNSSLSFQTRRYTISLDENDGEAITNSLFVLPYILFRLNILKTVWKYCNFGTKDSRRAWNVFPAQEVVTASANNCVAFCR